MKGILWLLPVVYLLNGCAAVPLVSGLINPNKTPAQLLSSTTVDLSKQNYRIVKANVVGVSKGFKLFGLISFKSANYSKAMTKLYEQANVTEGKPQAVANLLLERSSTYFILFSLPKVRVRADLVEFEGGPWAGQAGVTNRVETSEAR